MPGVTLKHLRLFELEPAQTDTCVVFMVLTVKKPLILPSSPVVEHRMRVADSSGIMDLHVIGDRGASIKAGDIIRLRNGFPWPFRDAKMLYALDEADIDKIGEFSLYPGPNPHFTLYESGENGYEYRRSFERQDGDDPDENDDPPTPQLLEEEDEEEEDEDTVD